jgi:hypothetical protein
MIVKQEEFKTPEGVKRFKSYSTHQWTTIIKLQPKCITRHLFFSLKMVVYSNYSFSEEEEMQCHLGVFEYELN